MLPSQFYSQFTEPDHVIRCIVRHIFVLRMSEQCNECRECGCQENIVPSDYWTEMPQNLGEAACVTIALCRIST